MADLRTAEQCYRTAARLLATSEGPLRQRLLHAYLFQGVRAYPPDIEGALIVDGFIAERMRELHYSLTAEGDDRHRCSIEVTIDTMTDDDIEEAANELVEIAAELSYRLGQADQPDTAQISPLHGKHGSTYIRYPRAV